MANDHKRGPVRTLSSQIRQSLESCQSFLSLLQSFAWLSPLVIKFPIINKMSAVFGRFAIDRVLSRKKNGAVNKDLFYHLVRLSSMHL